MERYKSITSAYYRGAKGVIICYDITRKNSFDNVDKWLDDFKSKADEDAVILLIGNKNDLNHIREVDKEEAALKAQKYNIGFMETSAKENDNVQKAFITIFQEIINVYKEKNGELLNNNIGKDGKSTKKNGKIIKGSMSGLSGGYTIQMDTIQEDNIIEDEAFGKKNCC